MAIRLLSGHAARSAGPLSFELHAGGHSRRMLSLLRPHDAAAVRLSLRSLSLKAVLRALGPAIIAVFLTCIGWAAGFYGLLGMVILSGIGAAAFHPQAASNAVAAITRNRASAMALFISCGTFGMAAGPVCFSPLLAWLGLEKLSTGRRSRGGRYLVDGVHAAPNRQSTQAHRANLIGRRCARSASR